MANESISMNEGCVVLNSVVQRELVEVETQGVATEKDTDKRQQGCEGERQVVDGADGLYEFPEADVFAVMRTIDFELCLKRMTVAVRTCSRGLPVH